MPNCAVCFAHFLSSNWLCYLNPVAGADDAVANAGDADGAADAGGGFVDAGGRFVATMLSLTVLYYCG